MELIAFGCMHNQRRRIDALGCGVFDSLMVFFDIFWVEKMGFFGHSPMGRNGGAYILAKKVLIDRQEIHFVLWHCGAFDEMSFLSFCDGVSFNGWLAPPGEVGSTQET